LPSNFPPFVAFDPHEELSLLSPDALDLILSHVALRLHSEDWLLSRLLPLGCALHHVLFEFVCPDSLTLSLLSLSLDAVRESTWQRLAAWLPRGFASAGRCPESDFDWRMIWDFPAVFGAFCGRKVRLLWHGSRDGFAANDFHRACDGHANTITLIRDTNGNIFGGFIPVAWETRRTFAAGKADESGQTFLFTLLNPHEVAARKFALRIGTAVVICCSAMYGPTFGGTPADLYVANACQKTESNTFNFGCAFINDTGMNGATFFTRAKSFCIKDIVVLQVDE
jgi:hypothetical protein